MPPGPSGSGLVVGVGGYDYVALLFGRRSGSWLNLVEIFFGIITRQAIRCGAFTSVRDLIAAIEHFIDGWDDRCCPLTWTTTPDDLLDTQTAAGAGRRDGLDDDATLVTIASPGRAARDVPSQASVA